MIVGYTFGAGLAFSARSGPSRTKKYGAGSIAEEKVDIARKTLQRGQLCWSAGRVGV